MEELEAKLLSVKQALQRFDDVKVQIPCVSSCSIGMSVKISLYVCTHGLCRLWVDKHPPSAICIANTPSVSAHKPYVVKYFET